MIYRKVLGILLVTLAFSQLGQAQLSSASGLGSGKVSQMSDQQIQQLWLQAQKSGMSENDAMKMLVQKGMDPSDVNTFKKRLVQIQGNSKNLSQPLIKDTSNFLKDTTWLYEVPRFKRRLPYYGYDFFNSPTVSFEPSLIISPPKNYPIGPGDEITLTLTGLNDKSIADRVSREGNFLVPYVGAINLNGLTVEEAVGKLKVAMKTAYPALTSGKTQLLLTIDKVRSINIYIQGEVENPGKYTVSALTGFINVLYKSGGPNTIGSLRALELIRNNKVIETIDFYSFLQKGLLEKNILLQDMDIIRFPVYSKRVVIAGEIKRPAIYELLEKESMADLLKYAGGFGDTAYKSSVKVMRLDDQERSIHDVKATDFSVFIPKTADSVYVDKILSRYSNRVVLTGAVQRPGAYELSNGLTAATLIKNSGGLREDAFASRGYIKRRKPEDASRELLWFDVKKLLAGTDPDISLVREDSIMVAAIDSLQDQPQVSTGGSIRNPGNLGYRKGMSVGDAIIMSGGFAYDAALHKVEISRLEKNTSDTLANKLISIITIDVDPGLTNAGAKTMLEPLDYIFVPRLLNYRAPGGIKLRGEVLYAGDYSLERRDETMQELISRVGGVTPYASLKDVQVYRNNLRIATTIFAEGNSQKFLLLPGDSIFIPRNESFVEVKGAVFTPQILKYESNRFLSYISGTGGVTDRGNLGKAYIQYSNGVNKKIRHFLIFRHYPKVLPGSKIIVPEHAEGEKRGLSILELTTITSILTALLGAISLFKNL